MPIIRRKLDPNTVYPEDIQYDPETEKVQRKINGDWVDSPESDPRHQTTLPPRITANTACDAAQSVVDALKGQIDSILEAIDNSGTAFTIAGIILSLFTFGVFAIFVSIALTIANAMLDAGTTALSAALTDPVYHTLACILSCHMDENGRLTADGLAGVESDVSDQIGGLAAVILNSMLSLAGEGGVNNIASLGASTGDCSDCNCACQSIDVAFGHSSPVFTGQIGEMGHTYHFVCTGTGDYAVGSGYFGDAFYYTPGDDWATQVNDGTHQLHVDGFAITPPSYSGSHVYEFDLPGTGMVWGLQLPDEDPSNDSGHIHVQICIIS